MILMCRVYLYVLISGGAYRWYIFSEVSSIHGTLIQNTGYRNTIRSVGIAYRFPRSPTWRSSVKDSWFLVEWETRYICNVREHKVLLMMIILGKNETTMWNMVCCEVKYENEG